MLKHSVLLFLGFLALASAAFTPEENFFFLPYSNGLANQIYQTRHGIIAYSVDLMADSQYAPHYVQIDMETNNVTEILHDLTSACGQGPSAFDRFHYHVLTYSFVYYCTNNNSILILDPQNNFNVQSIFSLSITETFDEVRIITDGYSVSILGLSGSFSQSPGPSHLIKYSLQTQQVVNHVVFDHDFAAGEAVTAYSAFGSSMFIITNIISSTTNIANIYTMTLIGNSYSLTRLSTFNSTSSSPYTLPEFYVLKNLIITSNEDTLVILDQSGNIQKTQDGVALNQFPLGTQGTTFKSRPVIISYPGSGDTHILLQNSTILQVSQVNSGFTMQSTGNATSITIALQDQLTNNLLFSFSEPNENFRITNLDSGAVKYQSVANFTNFMITDKTYSAISPLNYLYIFDRETNDLIQLIPLSNNWYYDQKSSTLSFLILNGTNYIFQQIDLTTGTTYTPLSVPFVFPDVNSVQLIHATNNDNFESPELVIHTTGSSEEFLIVSQSFGQVKFVLDNPSSSYVSTLAVDYDTLTAFYFLNTGNSQSISITEYTYVSSNNSFVSAKTNQVLMNGNIIPATDYSVIATPGKVAVIDMSTLSETDYSFSTQWTYPSTFQNSTNGFNMVLSQAPQWGAQESQPQSAGILYANQLEELPGTTSNTVQAGTAGSCSYWVVNQVGSFGVVQYYNICDTETFSEIIA